jgi:hypothetical protein
LSAIGHCLSSDGPVAVKKYLRGYWKH